MSRYDAGRICCILGNRPHPSLLSYRPAWTDLSRDADCDRMRWHILQHHRIRPNRHIVTNHNISKNLRSRPNINPIANPGCAPNACPPQPNRYPVANHHIIAKDGISTNDNIAKVLSVSHLLHIPKTFRIREYGSEDHP